MPTERRRQLTPHCPLLLATWREKPQLTARPRGLSWDTAMTNPFPLVTLTPTPTATPALTPTPTGRPTAPGEQRLRAALQALFPCPEGSSKCPGGRILRDHQEGKPKTKLTCPTNKGRATAQPCIQSWAHKEQGGRDGAGPGLLPTAAPRCPQGWAGAGLGLGNPDPASRDESLPLKLLSLWCLSQQTRQTYTRERKSATCPQGTCRLLGKRNTKTSVPD